ncbi:MAG: hypothetical protein IIY12_06290 [Clostridia bacterium]|nr:hypothetical protein [Clostridia bacterium]
MYSFVTSTSSVGGVESVGVWDDGSEGTAESVGVWDDGSEGTAESVGLDDWEGESLWVPLTSIPLSGVHPTKIPKERAKTIKIDNVLSQYFIKYSPFPYGRE